jgi:uncharacterized Zn-binding protein involved in type VI secretion
MGFFDFIGDAWDGFLSWLGLSDDGASGGGGGLPSARISDSCSHGGSIVEGEPTVLILGKPAARIGDNHSCPYHGSGAVVMGSSNVLIGDKPAARLTDDIVCRKGTHKITSGAETVLIGGIPPPSSPEEAELAELNKELIKELAISAVDLVGIVDPTPISDGVGAFLSLRQGDFIGAGLSLISIVPYAGDALGKTAKGARMVKRLNKIRKRMKFLRGKIAKKRLLASQRAVPSGAASKLDNLKITPTKADEVITSKYGKHLDDSKKGGGLAQNNTEVLDDASFKKKYTGGSTDPDDLARAERVDGFYDPATKKQFVNGDKDFIDETVMHESLHMYSSEKWIDGVPDGLNEGVTEHLAKINTKGAGAHYAGGAYPSSTWMADRVSKKVGDDVLSEAYFTGNVGKLQDAWEKASPGKDSWNKLLGEFDTKYARDMNL